MKRAARRTKPSEITIGLTKEQIECIANAMIFSTDKAPVKIGGAQTEVKVNIVNVTIFEERMDAKGS